MVTGLTRVLVVRGGHLQATVVALAVSAAVMAVVAAALEDIQVLGVLVELMVVALAVVGVLVEAVEAAVLAEQAVAGLVFWAQGLMALAALAAQLLLILVEAAVQAGLLEVTVTVILHRVALEDFMVVAVAVALLVIRVQQGVQPVAVQSVLSGPAQPVNSHRQTLGHLNF